MDGGIGDASVSTNADINFKRSSISPRPMTVMMSSVLHSSRPDVCSPPSPRLLLTTLPQCDAMCMGLESSDEGAGRVDLDLEMARDVHIAVGETEDSLDIPPTATEGEDSPSKNSEAEMSDFGSRDRDRPLATCES